MMDHLQESWNGDFLAYCNFWRQRRYWGWGPKKPFIQWRREQQVRFEIVL